MKILITGGRSDIGFEMAKLYTEKGHDCIVTASSIEGVMSLKERYSNIPRVKIVSFNLLNPNENSEEIESIITEGIEGVVFNASTKVNELKLLHETSLNEQKNEIDGNIKGNLWLLRKVLPVMMEKKFGRLILISSAATTCGMSRYGLYCLSKGGMESLFLNLAVDYGEYNILSNILRPGIIRTERTRRFWKRETYVKKTSEKIPQKMLGEAYHIAKASLAFVEEDSYVNGASLNVSGGLPLTRID